jgi:hypothetical protein
VQIFVCSAAAFGGRFFCAGAELPRGKIFRFVTEVYSNRQQQQFQRTGNQ